MWGWFLILKKSNYRVKKSEGWGGQPQRGSLPLLPRVLLQRDTRKGDYEGEEEQRRRERGGRGEGEGRGEG
jgi:hypothetical protein